MHSILIPQYPNVNRMRSVNNQDPNKLLKEKKCCCPRILIVDYDELNVYSVKLLLEAFGYKSPS